MTVTWIVLRWATLAKGEGGVSMADKLDVVDGWESSSRAAEERRVSLLYSSNRRGVYSLSVMLAATQLTSITVSPGHRLGNAIPQRGVCLPSSEADLPSFPARSSIIARLRQIWLE
jgi:hypothetical protein